MKQQKHIFVKPPWLFFFFLIFTLLITSNSFAKVSMEMSSGITLEHTKGEIEINGDWTNSGTFIPSTGTTVTLKGTTAQTINNADGEQFYNLIIDNQNLNFAPGMVKIAGEWQNNTIYDCDGVNVIFNGIGNQEFLGSQFYTVTVDKSGGMLSAVSDMLITNHVNLLNGNLYVNDDNGAPYTLSLGEAATITEDDGKYLIGWLEATRSVGTGSSDFGGMGLEIDSGTDDWGNVKITRVSGDTVKVKGVAGINRRWRIQPGNQPVNERDITFLWNLEDENNINLNMAQVWKSPPEEDFYPQSDKPGTWEKAGLWQDISGSNSHQITIGDDTFGDTDTFSWWTINDDDVPDTSKVDFRVMSNVTFSANTSYTPHKVEITANIRAYDVKEPLDNIPVKFYADDMEIGSTTISFPIIPSATETVSCRWSPPDYTDYEIIVKVDPDNIVEEADEENNEFTKILDTQELVPPDITIDASQLVMSIIGNAPIYDINLRVPVQVTKPLGGNMENVKVRFEMNDLGDASRAYQIIGEATIDFTNGEMTETQYADVDWLPVSQSKRSGINSYYMPDRHYEHDYQVKIEVDIDNFYAESDENNTDTITDQLMDFVPPDFRVQSTDTQISTSNDDTKPIHIKTKIYADSLVTYLDDLKISFYYRDLDENTDQVLVQSNFHSFEGTDNQISEIDWLPLYYHNYSVIMEVNSDQRYTESNIPNSTAGKNPKLLQDFKPDIYLEGNDYVFDPTGSKPYDASIDVPIHVTKYVKNMPDVAVTVIAKNREDQSLTTLYDQNITFSQSNKYETHTVENIFWDLPGSDVPDYLITAKVDANKAYDEKPNEANNVASKEFGGVKIKRVTPQWDRLPNDPSKVGRFIPRVSLENQFTVSINDPNDMGIDHVEFKLAGETQTDFNGNNGWKATFDMGELQNDPKLKVIAYDSWGIATQKEILEIETIDELLWLKYLLNLLNEFEYTECEKDENRAGDGDDEGEEEDCNEVNLSPVMVDITDDGYLKVTMALGKDSVLGKLTNKKGSTTEDAKGVEDQDSGGSGEITFTLEFGLNPGTGARGDVEVGYSDKACGKKVELPFDVTITGEMALDPQWELDYAEAGLNVNVLVFEMPETKLFAYNFAQVIQVFIKLSMDIHAEVDLLCYLGPDARFRVDKYNSGKIEKASHVKLGPTVNGVLKLGVGDATGCFEVGCAAKPSLSMFFYVNWYHQNQQAGTDKGKILVDPGMEVLFSVDGSLYVSVLWGMYEWEFLETNLMDVTCDIPFKNPNNACCGCSFLNGMFAFNEDCYFGDYARGGMPVMNVPIILPSPSMDSDNLGNVFTVFTREVADPNYPELADAEIFYFTRDPLGNVSEPMQITHNEAFETNPKFNFINDNLGMLVWTQNTIGKDEFVGRARSGSFIQLPEATSKQDIYYSVWDGTNWSDGTPIISDSSESAKSDGMTSISALGDSTAIACWVRATGDSTQHKSGWQIYSSVYADSAWSAPAALPGQDGAGNFGVKVAGNADGNEATAVWSKVFDYDDPGATYNIYASHWQKSTGNWTEPVALENSTAQNKYADVAYLNDGSAAACWIREITTEVFRQVDVFDSFAVDTFWVDPHNYYLDTLSIYTQETVIDTILVNHLMAAHRDSGDAWGSPEIALIDSQFIETPSISVSDQGVAVITFSKSSTDNTAGDLFSVVKNYDTGGSWSEPRQLTDDPYTNMSIASDIDANNNTVMVSQTWDFADTAAVMRRMRGERSIDPYGGLSMRSYGMDRSGEFYDGINISYASIAPDFKLKDKWITISDYDSINIISDTLSMGDTLWVSVPVKNVGYAPSDTATTVAVYNAHPDSAAAILMASITVPALAVDSTFTAEFNLIAAEDNTNLFFVVNPDTAVVEQSWLNNMAQIRYDLVPDFTVTNVWLSNETPSEGEIIQIGAEITNLQGITGNNISIACREDVSDTTWKWLDVDDIQIINTLMVGQKDTVYFDYAVTGGYHNFRVTVNPDSTIAESDYKNNCPGNTGGVILHAYSDMELVESSINVLAGSGSFTNIEATITNIGQFTAYNIPVQLFDGHPLDSATLLIDSLVIPMLGSEQQTTVQLTFTGISGQHDLQIWVNQGHVFPESDYGNNSAKITIYQHQTSDLAVNPDEIGISNALPVPADTVEVSIVVRNEGDVSATDIPVWLYRVDGELLISISSALIDQLDPTVVREIPSSKVRQSANSASKKQSSKSKLIGAKSKKVVRSTTDPDTLVFSFVIEDSLSGLTQYQLIVNPDKDIAERDFDNNGVEFYLNINGISGQAGKLIASTEDSLDFDRIQVGEMDTLNFVLSNTGDEAVAVTDFQLGTSGMFSLTIDQTSFILSPGIDKDVGVIFMPEDNFNEISDTLFVVNTSTNAPELTVKLAGFSISAPIVDIPDTTLAENAPTMVYADLNEFVVDNDGDAVVWTIAGFDTTLLDSVKLGSSSRSNNKSPSKSKNKMTSKQRNTNEVWIYPDQTTSGTAWITFKATDPDGLTDLDRVTITIPEFNLAPVINDASIQIDEDEFISIKLNSLATDPDGDELEWDVLADNPPEITVHIDDEHGNLIITPEENIFGEFDLYLKVSDNKTVPDTVTIALTVNSVNDLPVWSILPTVEFDEDTTFTVDLTPYVSDVETPDSLLMWQTSVVEENPSRSKNRMALSKSKSQSLSKAISKEGRDSNLIVIVDGDGLVTFMPAENWNGIKQVQFKAIDEENGETAQATQVTVNSLNDVPYFISTPQDTIVYADSTYYYLIISEDVDMTDILSLESPSGLPDWLNLLDNGDGTGELTGIPTAADSGSYVIEISVKDTANAMDIQTYNLHVHSCRLYDVNCDGTVDVLDVQKISAMFGIDVDNSKYDFDGSGTIDKEDLKLIIIEWKK